MKPNAKTTATRLAGSAKGCHSGTMAWCRNHYKAGAKAAGVGLTTSDPFSWSLRPNYFGDWLR